MQARKPDLNPSAHTSSSHWYAPFIGAAIGGTIETASLHPFDTIAKRLQRHEGRIFSWHGNLKSSLANNMGSLNSAIFRDQASQPLMSLNRWSSLYPGVGFGMVYKVIQRTYKLGVQHRLQKTLEANDQFAELFEDDKKRVKVWAAGVSGSLVGAGEVILLPLDVLKIKFQTNKAAYDDKSFLDIWKAENPYKGLSMTLPRNIVGSFALFGVREVFRTVGANSDVSNAAGSAASILLSSPFDVIKTRMQSQKETVGAWSTIKNTYANEGCGAFYKGALVKVITQGPKLVVCLAVADRVAEKIPEWIESRRVSKNAQSFFGSTVKKAQIVEAVEPTSVVEKSNGPR